MTAEYPVTVVGLDLSLSSTGVAVARSDLSVSADRIRPHPKLRGHERLGWLSARVGDFTGGACLVVVEGPSYGSKGGCAHERAGLWWLVTHRLWRAGVPTAVVAPASLKKYATGRGNAGKDEVLAGVVRRFPGVAVDGNDEADAVVLAAMGADKLGFPPVPMPAAHREALVKVSWPELSLLEEMIPS
jgi:hypothetical protein